jgi:hypothetical protein
MLPPMKYIAIKRETSKHHATNTALSAGMKWASRNQRNLAKLNMPQVKLQAAPTIASHELILYSRHSLKALHIRTQAVSSVAATSPSQTIKRV